MDFLDYISARMMGWIVWLVNFMPVPIKEAFFRFVARTVIFFVPRYKRIALRNLRHVFPGMGETEIQALFQKHIKALAHFANDSTRLHTLDREWAIKHVKFPDPNPLEYLSAKTPGKGALIATGHLGSFELFGAVTALHGYPLDFVVRNFKGRHLDAWWTSMRERHGNKVIARNGAFNEVVQEIQRGRNTAILFDQNVKRNHAVFVDFFGRPAATTKALALAAIKTRAIVIVSFLQNTEGDYYTVRAEECDFSAIYNNEEMSVDRKVFEITQRVTKVFEEMILMSPHEWFWMHRRWKTAPQGMEEDFYS